MASIKQLAALAKLIRYFILTSTTTAGSGHPTSSLSATDLMAVLMFSAKGGSASGGGGPFFKADLEHPKNPNNDRLIFSKGHAAPLLYALYAAAGKVSEKELLTLRKFGSRLEGHPTLDFPYAEAATGSLGQGLSIGVGMALNAKLDKLSYKTYVLLGDSEMAEGSVWEAIQLASHYQLNNLIAILDVNRLGQRGETMYGHDVKSYEKKLRAFSWETVVIDGHDLGQITTAFEKATNQENNKSRPVMIITKTLKGKGISFIENKDGWHGKTLSADELKKALVELGEVDKKMRGTVSQPAEISNFQFPISKQFLITQYSMGDKVATRKAYGNALVKLVEADPRVVVLDAEVSNSTYSEFVKKTHAERFFEMYIAEQNMVGTALGFSRRGKIPFVSTFAAFFTRAFDQIRMSQYSNANIKFVGSHGGVSIGEDGPSQMGLEDIAMFRSVGGMTVLYPCDAVATEKLVEAAAKHAGNVYLRTTRQDTPVIYSPEEKFPIGGSKVLRQSKNDIATVVVAGVTVLEALAAYEELKKADIFIRVIDLYSVKPLDIVTLTKAEKETKAIITVEDHYAEGGIGEAVMVALSKVESLESRVHTLAVKKMPRSGKPAELLAYEEIDAMAIVKACRDAIHRVSGGVQ